MPGDPLWRLRLEECCERCARPAWRLAYVILRDAGDAYDAVQQAFLVAAAKPDRIPADDPWPWFSVVVLHEARNARRKRRPELRSPTLEGESTLESADPTTEEPARVLQREELHAQLWEEVGALPPVERDAILITHVCGVSHAAAAEALAVPRQTLTSRVERGIARLRARFATSDRGLAEAFAIAPIALPLCGWDAAFAGWKSTMLAHAAQAVGVGVAGGTAMSTAAGSAAAGAGQGLVGGGVIVLKKSLVVIALSLGVGLGWAGKSHFAGPGTLDQEHQGSVAVDESPDAAGAMAGDDGRGPSKRAGTPSADAVDAEGRLALADARKAELARENEALRAEVAALRTQMEQEPKIAASGPMFTFGEGGQLDAVLEADWSEMAQASTVVSRSLEELWLAKTRGEEPPKGVMLALQENTERVRKYEYRVFEKLPTAAQYNGELTHPISVTNLIAAVLDEGGVPLSEAQIVQVNRLGMKFETTFAAMRSGYPPNTLRATRVLEEYLLKGEFTEDLAARLTDDQRALLWRPGSRGRAYLDLFCPTLMIIHTSPLVTGASAEEISGKLVALVSERYGIGESDKPRLDPLASRWITECAAIIANPIEPYALRDYTFEQGAIAGEATIELLSGLLADFELDDATRQKILDDPAFFIPRKVKPEPKAETPTTG